MNQGVVYVATGEKCLNEARASAWSLRENSPGIHVTLFTDADIQADCFDAVRIMDKVESGPLNKIRYIANSPYRKSLYLDSDTYICQDISDLFLILDRFDLAAAHAPIRKTLNIAEIPAAFPEFNAGVILYRMSEPVIWFLDDWMKTYHYMNTTMPELNTYYIKEDVPDQPSFRICIYKSGLRIATLSPEYNCRYLPVYLNETVKIIHGRYQQMAKVAKLINMSELSRCFLGTRVILHKDNGEFVTYTEEDIQ